VEGAKFSRLDADVPEPSGLKLERHLPYLLALLGLLTLLAMLIVFLRAVKAAQKPAGLETAQLEGGMGADMASMLEAGEEGANSPLGPGAPEAPELSAPTPAELEDRRVRAIELASKDPVGAAIILTRWLSSGEQTASQHPGGAA
jgi:hypothetical protein